MGSLLDQESRGPELMMPCYQRTKGEYRLRPLPSTPKAGAGWGSASVSHGAVRGLSNTQPLGVSCYPRGLLGWRELRKLNLILHSSLDEPLFFELHFQATQTEEISVLATGKHTVPALLLGWKVGFSPGREHASHSFIL